MEPITYKRSLIQYEQGVFDPSSLEFPRFVLDAVKIEKMFTEEVPDAAFLYVEFRSPDDSLYRAEVTKQDCYFYSPECTDLGTLWVDIGWQYESDEMPSFVRKFPGEP